MTRRNEDKRRAMEEAALVPENDRSRRELEARLDIESEGDDRETWLTILAQNESLRKSLDNVELPAGLLTRVRAVRGPSRPSRRFPVSARTAALGAAASLLLAAIGIQVVRPEVRAPEATHELATIAAMDHAARPKMTVTTDDPDVLVMALRDSVPFQIHIPNPAPGATLLGGRRCSFGDQPIVYTRWRTESGDIALYQMEHEAFELKPHLAPVSVEMSDDASPGSHCRVRVWSDERFAYVIVTDDHGSGG